MINIDKKTALFKLESNSDKTGICWLYLSDGTDHIRVTFSGHILPVHRVSAHIFLGLDLNNQIQQANHRSICPNKNCWNPDHLYIGTQIDNMKDERGKFRNETCKYGHLLDGRIYLSTKGKTRRYCRICHNEQSKRSEKKMRRIGRRIG